MGFADEPEEQLLQPMLEKLEKPELPPPFQEPYAHLAVPNSWSTGLYDCFAQPGGGALGCVAICVPFVQYGVIAEQLPKNSTCLAGDFAAAAGAFLCLDLLSGAANCSVCPGISLLPTSALLHVRMRRHLREKYNIEGTYCKDLCTAWWCGPCALAQETRELVIRNAADRQAARMSGAAVPPVAPYMMGHMVLPPPSHDRAAPAAAPQLPPAAVPATGVPVAAVVPETTVATVTLAQGEPAEQQPAKAC